MCEVKNHLSVSGVVNTDLAVPLFDCLLRVALAKVFAPATVIEEKPKRVRAYLVKILH